MISTRIDNITFSGTMEIAAQTFELKSKGFNVIDLCVGEPDLPTPDYIKQAAFEAISSDKTKYTLNTGIKELRNAISEKYLKEFSAKYLPEEIIVSNGAKQSIFNVLQTIIETGDEVLIPKPFYVSYPHMVRLSGGIPIFIDTKRSNSFNPTKEEIEKNISSKTKAIIICNPNNPTGSVFSSNELMDILNIALEKNILVIADEIYEKLVYNNSEFISVSSFGEKYKNNIVIINGVSKTYAMTGWRIGYAIAPKYIVEGMNKFQSHSTSNACTISQYAALAALTHSQETVEDQRKIFEERCNFIKNSLMEIEDVTFVQPSGAFYYFIDISKLIEKYSSINNSKDFCLKLLHNSYVATVPGIEFGLEGYIRISYAKSINELKEAFIRIKDFIQQLQ